MSGDNVEVESIKVTGYECPQCGDEHPEVPFRRLSNPIGGANFWAQCPTNGEPILTTYAG